jgi:hypothetical protein
MFWVTKCITSCTNLIQLENAKKLIDFYANMYEHLFFCQHLEEMYEEHKTFLNKHYEETFENVI